MTGKQGTEVASSKTGQDTGAVTKSILRFAITGEDKNHRQREAKQYVVLDMYNRQAKGSKAAKTRVRRPKEATGPTDKMKVTLGLPSDLEPWT